MNNHCFYSQPPSLMIGRRSTPLSPTEGGEPCLPLTRLTMDGKASPRYWPTRVSFPGHGLYSVIA
ncbi:uncharacterized protein J3R85_007050 [Psidium guajava]|nr:uncharacterized protein J3R85_007050 [Psidium guajava]